MQTHETNTTGLWLCWNIGNGLILLLLILFFTIKTSRGQCPTNLQFELGNFNHWETDTGFTYNYLTNLTINHVSIAPLPNFHSITPSNYSGFFGNDSIGNFPVVCPYTPDPYSVRIATFGLEYRTCCINYGNMIASSIKRYIRIPSNVNSYNLTYYYALVFYSSNHSAVTTKLNSRFKVEVYDSITGVLDTCSSFDIVAPSSFFPGLPGFITDITNPALIYRPWYGALINIKNKGGSTMAIRFTVIPCYQHNPHFAVAYLDFSPFCTNSPVTNGYCPGSSVVPLYAPPGFQTYSWYDSTGALLGINDTLLLPVSNVSSACVNLNLIVSPYFGYGCPDTLPVQVCLQPKPTANFAFIDSYCVASPCVFFDSSASYAPGTWINHWLWNFGDPVSGTSDSSTQKNPIHYFNTPGNYSVSLIVKNNVSCVSDTLHKTIHITQPNAAPTLTMLPDTACSASPVAVTWGGVQQAGYSYTWAVNGGTMLSGNATVPTPISAAWLPMGNQTATLTVLPQNPNLTACGSVSTGTVFIKGIIPQFTINGTNTICGGSAVLTADTISTNGCKAGSSTCLLPNLFTSNVTSLANYPSPFMGDYRKARNRMLFTPQELQAIGITTAGAISSMAFNVQLKNSTKPYPNFTVKMACVSDTAFVGGSHLPIVAATQVFSGNYITSFGWNTIPFTTSYLWDGTSNLYVETCFQDTGITGRDYIYSDAGSPIIRYQHCEEQLDSLPACDANFPTTAFYGLARRPSVRFAFCPNQIATPTVYAWSILPASAFTASTASINVSPTATTTYQCMASNFGCSSTNTFTITVNNTTGSSFSQSICSNQTFLFKGTNLNTTGIYKDTLTNYVGCDSVITLTLTVKPTSSISLSQTICSNQTFLFNGNNLNTTGVYKDTLTNYVGCDSVITLTLTVKPTSSSSFSQAICSNQTYLFNGTNLNTTGIYKDTLTNYVGCDSIISLQLTVLATSASSINATICSNQTYFFNNTNLNVSGSYKDTLTNYRGCDSIITLNLVVNPVSTISINQSICSNQTYILPNGQPVSVAGSYIDTLPSHSGCDSIITTNLTFINQPTVFLGNDTTICNSNVLVLSAPLYPNAVYLWNDNSTATTLTATTTGLYTVLISLSPCPPITDTISIISTVCDCALRLPNVFSPNADGLNDEWKPIVECYPLPTDYELKILNRWGQLIFTSSNIQIGWNGSYKATPQEIGTYIYLITYVNPTTNTKMFLKGDVSLVR